MKNALGENVRIDIEYKSRDIIRCSVDDFFSYKELKYKIAYKVEDTIELLIANPILAGIIIEPPLLPQTKSYIKNQIKENL